MNDGEKQDDGGIEVRTYFVRGRNALLARADFSPLYVEYYLHLATRGLRHAPQHDSMLKDALAAMTLHCASRPWHESTAWTINFQEPRLNLFVTGNSEAGTVVGNVFTDDVKVAPHQAFHAEIFQKRASHRKSSVNFAGADCFRAVETYYEKSEQRPARYFRYADEDFVMITAQPDCDFAWFRALDEPAIRDLDGREQLRLLEQRRYGFACGCTQARLLDVLAPILKSSPDELFGQSEVVMVACPRCGARHKISRESLEAWLAERPRAGHG